MKPYQMLGIRDGDAEILRDAVRVLGLEGEIWNVDDVLMSKVNPELVNYWKSKGIFRERG